MFIYSYMGQVTCTPFASCHGGREIEQRYGHRQNRRTATRERGGVGGFLSIARCSQPCPLHAQRRQCYSCGRDSCDRQPSRCYDPEQSDIFLNAIQANVTVQFPETTAARAVTALGDTSSAEYAAWADEFASRVHTWATGGYTIPGSYDDARIYHLDTTLIPPGNIIVSAVKFDRGTAGGGAATVYFSAIIDDPGTRRSLIAICISAFPGMLRIFSGLTANCGCFQPSRLRRPQCRARLA